MEQLSGAPHFSRIRWLMVAMAVLGAIFVIRLFYLQVVMHGHYQAEAIKEHTSKFTISAKRGLIYAHDGKEQYAKLALNEPVYTAYADPRYVKDINHVAGVLRRIAGGNLVDGFEDGLHNKDLQYTVLARQITKTQAELIKKENLPGVGLQEQEKRVYPEGSLAAHILGFVNTEGQGQYGIEQALQQDLAGQDGLLQAVTDVYGIPLSIGEESVHTPPKQGKNIVLTIDRNIQHRAEQILREGLKKVDATKGSVLVVDPYSGDILAMANAPAFNPGEYGKVQDYEVFQNRAISEAYEPGSIIKSFTMGAALNEKIITPESTYNNTGSVQVADAKISNILTSPTGSVNMTQVLEYSFNTGVVHVLKLLGGGDINRVAKQKLYQYFSDHYLFGRPTGVNLAGEATGDIAPPDDAQGGVVRYANMSFGQGMTATMLQVAAAFSAAVNGGVYYAPQIVDGHLGDGSRLITQDPKVVRSDVVSREASESLRYMLHQARTRSFLSHTDKPGYTIGGKTGTAQVYDARTGNYSTTETIGSYVGYGGQDKPQYVIIARVDDAKVREGYAGSLAAAPIFGELSNWLLGYMQIQPKP